MGRNKRKKNNQSINQIEWEQIKGKNGNVQMEMEKWALAPITWETEGGPPPPLNRGLWGRFKMWEEEEV